MYDLCLLDLDAANDCHCALMVYNKLVEIATKDGNNLDISCCARDIDPHKINEPRNCTATFGKDHGAQFPLSRTSSLPDYWMPEPPSLQYLRAYKMWHERKIPLERMCFEMKTGNRVEPLKATTVMWVLFFQDSKMVLILVVSTVRVTDLM